MWLYIASATTSVLSLIATYKWRKLREELKRLYKYSDATNRLRVFHDNNELLIGFPEMPVDCTRPLYVTDKQLQRVFGTSDWSRIDYNRDIWVCITKLRVDPHGDICWYHPHVREEVEAAIDQLAKDSWTGNDDISDESLRMLYIVKEM